MTAKDYGVRVLTAYENKRKGQIIFPPALLRDRLVQIGLVERVKLAEESEKHSGFLRRRDSRKPPRVVTR